jgi:fucose permease
VAVGSAFFDLPLDALGTLLVMLTTGYLLASFSSGKMLSRMNVGMLLALSCLATALGLVGYALAPGWGIIIALGLLAGIGAGAIDTGLNTYAATHFSTRSVNWLHACYGIGATMGPLIMTGVLNTGYGWQTGYAVVGTGQLALALCFGVTHKFWSNHVSDAQSDSLKSQSSNTRSPACPAPASTLRLPVVWLSIAVFFIYTGIEAAAGAWSTACSPKAVPFPW